MKIHRIGWLGKALATLAVLAGSATFAPQAEATSYLAACSLETNVNASGTVSFHVCTQLNYQGKWAATFTFTNLHGSPVALDVDYRAIIDGKTKSFPIWYGASVNGVNSFTTTFDLGTHNIYNENYLVGCSPGHSYLPGVRVRLQAPGNVFGPWVQQSSASICK